MRLLILTTDQSFASWKTRDSKLADIKKTLGKNWIVDWQWIDAKPKVVNGRIDHDWLFNLKEVYFNAGYDIIGLHLSMAQWEQYGLQSTLRGSNPRRAHEMGDFYVRADEGTKRHGFNQFVQTSLHEILHEYFQQTKLPDKTHEWHDSNPDIRPRFKLIDWSLYQPRRMNLKKQVSILTQLVQKLQQLVKKPAVETPNFTPPTSLVPLVQRRADAIVAEMARLGHAVRIVQGYRSITEQNKLYGQGRTVPGAIVTNAKGGESYHNYGVAVDFVFRKEGYNATEALWQLLGKVGKAQGFEWGGDWKGFIDRPHFELKLGHKLSDFQKGLVDYNKFK